MFSKRWPAGVVIWAALAVFAASVALAEDAGPTATFPGLAAPPNAADGGPASSDAGDAAPAPADLVSIRTTTRQVQALIKGELDVEVDPGSLFEVQLDDERAVLVQVERLSTLLRAALPDAGADAEATRKKTLRKTKPPKDAGADAEAGLDAAEPDADLWRAQLALDEARLSFLALPKPRRDELLARHQARQAEAEEAAKQSDVTEAQRKAEEAARARIAALEQVKRAESEAARVVAEERVRLLGVREHQAEYEAELARQENSLTERADVALSWRRRVRELVDARLAGQQSPSDVDALYSELIEELRGHARADLSSALHELSSGSSSVPDVGPNNLDTAGALVDRSGVDAARAELTAQEARLRERERDVRWRLASILMDQVESLNRDRLTLYPYLSSDRRSELTDFGGPGIEQAKAEGYQVALVVRYHVLTAARWFSDVKSGRPTAASGLLATVSLLKILGLLVLFVAWRRRASPLIASWHERAMEAAASGRSKTARWAERFTSFLPRVRSPLEWILLMWALMWLAGPAVADLLEVRVPWLVITWSMGAVLVVNSIDAFFSAPNRKLRAKDTAVLRLRSLRLLGRIVVAVGLTLALSAELVGKGTVYSWVLETCWLAAIPIGLVIVKWWREIIFERLAVRRKKSQFARLLLARQEGWASFPAAAAGGIYLIAVGVARMIRGYLTGLNITRRVLAFSFRREISNQARDRAATSVLVPLDDDQLAPLDPESPVSEFVPTEADANVQEVIDCIDAPGGGVFALVGERGAGKSTLLARIVRERHMCLVVPCPAGGLGPLKRELCKALGLEPGTSDDDIKVAINRNKEDNAILIDDAQRLVRPEIGGFDDLDTILAFARDACETCTWVFAMGAVTWRLVARARDSRPLFDDVIRLRPWSEESISSLLRQRSALTGLKPSFERLVTEPLDDDELERAGQLSRFEQNYYRLLWDYSEGNPAVALHFWRASLRKDDAGRVHVQLFAAPDTADLEALPDPAVFVLRAVVQLELAAMDDLVGATAGPRNQVADALRYGMIRGYLEVVNGRYRVRWTWFRAITKFLQRRHLLAAPGKWI